MSRGAVVVFLLASVILGVGGSWQLSERWNESAPELPVLADAPEFQLTDMTGETFRFQSLEGRVRVVNFFFARCPSICPRINGRLAEIFQEVRDNADPRVAFVSITVDPENDTPEVLQQYATPFRGDADNWKFLTGDEKVIQGLLDNGFKLASGMLPDQHSTRVVLVDEDGRIRGFYQGMEEEQLDQLESDLEKLL